METSTRGDRSLPPPQAQTKRSARADTPRRVCMIFSFLISAAFKMPFSVPMN
jgi:hypothetical protein